MKSVMVDNWFLQEVCEDRYISKNSQFENYGKLLSAIILWDEIYYPYNEMSKAWNFFHFFDFEGVLKPYDDSEQIFENLAEEIYANEYKSKGENSVVAGGAIRYLLMSNKFGVDYFPSDERSMFLQKHGMGDICNKLTRLDYLKPIDRQINEYFTELNDKLGKIVFTIKRPVLVDFIIQNAPKNMSYVEYALHLRQEGWVVQYRNYLDDIERALQNNEWKALGEMLKYSDSIVSHIINVDKKSIASINFKIAPIPSLSISKSLDISKNKVQLSFLENLAKFALSGRRYE